MQPWAEYKDSIARGGSFMIQVPLLIPLQLHMSHSQIYTTLSLAEGSAREHNQPEAFYYPEAQIMFILTLFRVVGYLSLIQRPGKLTPCRY